VNCYSLSDADGVDDAKDNCLFHINPDQLDTDGDGLGKSALCGENWNDFYRT
jgi:hypothetical protein